MRSRIPTTISGKCLEKQQPDVLVVATWPSSHLKNVLEAVRCGVKGILVEKPITVNTTQLEQMIQVTERAGILLMEAFMYRHHPLTLAVKQKIEEGAIGEVRYARSTFSTGLTDRQNWRLRGDLGGGAVMDLGMLLHQHHALSCWTRTAVGLGNRQI